MFKRNYIVVFRAGWNRWARCLARASLLRSQTCSSLNFSAFGHTSRNSRGLKSGDRDGHSTVCYVPNLLSRKPVIASAREPVRYEQSIILPTSCSDSWVSGISSLTSMFGYTLATVYGAKGREEVFTSSQNKNPHQWQIRSIVTYPLVFRVFSSGIWFHVQVIINGEHETHISCGCG